jgi:hypothetical protein
MVEDGKYLGAAGDGKFLKRKIPASILGGTSL